MTDNVRLAQALYEAECYGIGATSDTNQKVILEAAKALAAQPPAAPVDATNFPAGATGVGLGGVSQREQNPSAHNGCSAATGDAELLGEVREFLEQIATGFPVTESSRQHAATFAFNLREVIRAEPQSIKVTDAMCEAALDADVPDRIQGFSYKSKHVIRDVWSDEEIWTAPVVGPKEYQAFQKQCRIERMRKTLEAACSLSRPVSACEHDWQVWPETDGQSQRCRKCGQYRDTPRPHGGGK